MSTDYTFLGDPSVAQSAAVSTRYTSSSLRGILSDIHLLSKSDYLVCTFSSQVSYTVLYYRGDLNTRNIQIQWGWKTKCVRNSNGRGLFSFPMVDKMTDKFSLFCKSPE